MVLMRSHSSDVPRLPTLQTNEIVYLVNALQKSRITNLATRLLCSRRRKEADTSNPKRVALEILIRILGVALLTIFTGCAVGPNYKRPQATTIPAAYTGATNVVATDATNGWKVAQPQAQ